jgi:anti-sigma factor RsiW
VTYEPFRAEHDGRLAPRDVQRLEAHLAVCPHCSEYLAAIRELVDLNHRWQAET